MKNNFRYLGLIVFGLALLVRLNPRNLIDIDGWGGEFFLTEKGMQFQLLIDLSNLAMMAGIFAFILSFLDFFGHENEKV